MNILVINPGSTSTKLAIYHDRTIVWNTTIYHSTEQISSFSHVTEQMEMRMNAIRQALNEHNPNERFDVVIARGGLLHPTPGGVYAVGPVMIDHLVNAKQEHACNLGALMAHEIANESNCPALIADPEVVDELMPQARLTGLPHIQRRSIFHALNSKSVARRYAASIGRNYEDLRLIIVHLGGGISVGAHLYGKVVDVNNALNGDGPFSPERAGTLPADDLVDLCFSGQYTHRQMRRLLNGAGGLTALLGSSNTRQATELAAQGVQPQKDVIDALIYNVAKEIGSRAVALQGKVDAIILTGGIAHSQYVVDGIIQWAGFLGPIEVRAGEDELDSLAFNAYCALSHQLPILDYNPL